MPQRTIDSDYWTHDSVEDRSWNAKAFYLYLITNEHVNPAGVYHLTLKTMSFETGVQRESIPAIFKELSDKVAWYQDKNIVWVKNFIYRQGKSPKFIQAASKQLTSLNLNGVAREVLKYNMEKYNLSIPYPYRTYGVSVDKSELTKPAPDSSLTKDQNKEFGTICTIYEQNIGMLTPMTSERLKDIASNYPEGWFAMAVQEAVEYNKRNLRYIERVLENWSVNGVKTGLRQQGEQKQSGSKVKYRDVEEPGSDN